MNKPNEFTCAGCGETFEKGWTDEEAAADADAAFPGLMGAPTEERALVCDPCYNKMMGEILQ